MKKVSMWRIYEVIFMTIAFASFQAWPFWGTPPMYLSATLLAFSVLFNVVNTQIFRYERRNVFWFLMLLFSTLLTTVHANVYGFLEVVLNVLPLWFIFNLKDDYKSLLFGDFRKILALFLIVSLSYYALYLLGYHLPNSPIYRMSSAGARPYTNFYLFVQLPYLLFERFSSVFLEPGYLGCLMALLLFAGKYDFSWRKGWFNIVFIVCLFATFSLAGWLMAFLGYVFQILGKRRNKFFMSVLVLLVFGGLYVFFSTFNQGDNVVNNGIIARLEWDNQKGSIVGDRRTSENVTFYFYHQFLRDDNVFFGVDNAQNILENEDAADWKIYVIRYGFVGMLGFLFFLIYSGCFYREERYLCMSFSFLYLLMFLQTVHGIYWLMYIGTFILGIHEVSRGNKQ